MSGKPFNVEMPCNENAMLVTDTNREIVEYE